MEKSRLAPPPPPQFNGGSNCYAYMISTGSKCACINYFPAFE